MKKFFLSFGSLIILIVCSYYIFRCVQSTPPIFETVNPAAEIRFDLNKYGDSLIFSDFNAFDLFKKAQCDKCILTKDAYMVATYIYNEGGVSASLYKDEAHVSIFFYGKDKNKVIAILKSFVAYLGMTEKFKKGFDVCLNGICHMD